MDASPDVPEFFSQRRARFLSGLGRKAVERLPLHGTFRQIARADLERLIGRRLTAQDWNEATIAINRVGLPRAQEVEAA